jgi:hypothetical protein
VDVLSLALGACPARRSWIATRISLGNLPRFRKEYRSMAVVSWLQKLNGHREASR